MKYISIIFSTLILTSCSHYSKYGQKFDNAFQTVLMNEGGYVNDPDDHGGETKYGISKASYPDLDIKSITIADAKDIYYRDFWSKINLDSVYNDEVAIKIFDIYVNFSPERAQLIVKRALKSFYQTPTLLDQEENWNLIIPFVNNVSNTEALLAAIRSEQAALYRGNVERDPTQEKFIVGWLNRAYK